MLDEPFANIDPSTQFRLKSILKDLNKKVVINPGNSVKLFGWNATPRYGNTGLFSQNLHRHYWN